MKLTDNPDGSPRIGTNVISMSSPTLSSSANRHKESLFDIVEEASLEYYEGNTGLVNPRGRAIRESDGSVTYLPGPKERLSADNLYRKDAYTDALLAQHEGLNFDGAIKINTWKGRLPEEDGVRLSVNLDDWQGGSQGVNLPQGCMIATPTFLYSIAKEEQPEGPRKPVVKFKVMWELPLNEGQIRTGGAGNTPTRGTSSFARRMAEAEAGAGAGTP